MRILSNAEKETVFSFSAFDIRRETVRSPLLLQHRCFIYELFCHIYGEAVYLAWLESHIRRKGLIP